MVETHKAIKKVVCPACELVNLEKFVTFPHCAGCGALLSNVDAQKPPSVWRRPLRAPMWATAVAFCCAAVGFLGITIARETGRSVERQLIVYSQMPREMIVGRPTTLQFVLDTMAGDAETNLSQFDFVQIRIPNHMREEFIIAGITPFPDRTILTGAGSIIEFEHLQREDPIHLLLRAKHAGKHRLVLAIFVNDFTPYHFRRTVPVKAQTIYPSTASRKTKTASKAVQVAPKSPSRGEI